MKWKCEVEVSAAIINHLYFIISVDAKGVCLWSIDIRIRNIRFHLTIIDLDQSDS